MKCHQFFLIIVCIISVAYGNDKCSIFDQIAAHAQLYMDRVAENPLNFYGELSFNFWLEKPKELVKAGSILLKDTLSVGSSIGGYTEVKSLLASGSTARFLCSGKVCKSLVKALKAAPDSKCLTLLKYKIVFNQETSNYELNSNQAEKHPTVVHNPTVLFNAFIKAAGPVKDESWTPTNAEYLRSKLQLKLSDGPRKSYTVPLDRMCVPFCIRNMSEVVDSSVVASNAGKLQLTVQPLK